MIAKMLIAKKIAIAGVRALFTKRSHTVISVCLNLKISLAPLIGTIPRSFYIRFAKITLRNLLQAIFPTRTGYNVFRYQGFSASA
jgi:hypothetical protein